ncbi:cyanophycin synthetase [Limnohabitans sp. JirII-29]|uniref:cyanophycin synthetase n=1 Tax=Limnohabitans sp. JirII-29 TaxID=1835756 RepID=UPI000D34450D|nr:cyanophycin synthetase [Limnohabitans sp. JirII-29]PUE30298.1 cyanophycin synthetase [Limnohabitans sp. JirII-29]
MAFKDIQILRMNYLRGPNIWTYRPIIEALIDLGEMEDHPSNKIDGFNDRLNAWLPGLVEHHCGVGHRGGFLTRLVGGTWMGHIMEHVSIELQLLAGARAEFGKAREISKRGVYKVVFRTEHEELGRQSFLAAREIVMAAANNLPHDMTATINRLKQIADKHCLGPSTACIVDAAVERKTPFIRLTEGNLVQLGYGARQRRIWTAETDRTSAIAESISSDKDLTKRLLTQCGIPVPEGQQVESADEAWAAAQDIGLPVVVKPLDGNRGWGVSLDVNTEVGVRAAWTAAEKEGSSVLVERYVRGDEHRVLVVGDRVVAATRGETACVIGDGISTVEQLIESQVNIDPRRGESEGYPLDTIRLRSPRGEMSLLEIQRQGFEPESVPEKGKSVVVQRNGNLNIDVTDQVHPDVAAVATLAARVIGLDIAGIDIVTQDITRPLEQTGGAIIEVNAGPGLLMHIKPASGQPRPVGKAIVEHLFGPNESGRIPVVGIVGTHQTTQLSQLVAWLLHLSGKRTGLACQDGLYMDQHHVGTQDGRSFDVAERLLINRALDAAVFESSPLHILNEGLAYDRCQVGVVTDMPATDDVLIQLHDIQTPEQMRTVVRTQVDLVLPTGAAVLNADDAAVAGLAELSDGEVIFYSKDSDNPILVAHRQQGGRAVYCKEGHVALARGDQETLLFHLDLELIARLLKDGLHITTLLAAVATAWSLDIAPLLIRAGLKNFGQAAHQVAKDVARMNG